MALLTFSDKGIYCPRADVYIDPLVPVGKAIITHAHSDHSRPGNKHYAATPHTALIMKQRLGDIAVETYEYQDTFTINGVQFSFHPAGHIIGSAQVRVAYKDEIWVASGDYKMQPDPVATAFEPVKCHHFITESTFGLPIFTWEDESTVMAQIDEWVAGNKATGQNSVLLTYALGKAQRLLAGLAHHDPIFLHGAIDAVQQTLAPLHLPLGKTKHWQEYDKKQHLGSLILATPGSVASGFLNRFKPYSIAMASGWMAMRGTRRRRNMGRGFVLSDHADWDGLLKAIHSTEAQNIYVTHGYQSQLAKYLNEQGLNAQAVKTLYETEEE